MSAQPPLPVLHQGDLPEDVSYSFGSVVAIDTETMGLIPGRDRLCLVQLSAGDGTSHLVQFARGRYDAPNLRRLLTDANVTKLFHFGRFDIAVLYAYLSVLARPVYCTKIASRLVRTYTDKHGLKELCKEMLGTELNKQQQSSDWGSGNLSPEQMKYAASDVLYLHALKAKFDILLEREGRVGLATSCFEFLPARAALDLAGWSELDIFAH